MSRRSVSFLAFVLFAAALTVTFAPGTATKKETPLPRDIVRPSAVADWQSEASTRIAFAPNAGQWENDVRYAASIGASTLRVTDAGLSLALREVSADAATGAGGPFTERGRAATVRETEVLLRFVDARNAKEIVGRDPEDGRASFFPGPDQSRWRSDLPLFGTVEYLGLYDGVDARVYARDGHPEYDIRLSPGSDLANVQIEVDGARSLMIDPSGDLVISTELGDVRQPAPIAFAKNAAGERKEIACRFVLLGGERYGFSAREWDGESTLEIDPGLIFSSAISQELFAVDVDASGVIWIASVWTGWIAKVDPARPAGQQIYWTATFGGVGNLWDLATGPGGTVTVTGRSTGGIPTTSGAFDTTPNGSYDVFVTQFNPALPSGSQIVWSTYLGGSGFEWGGYGLDVDTSGYVYVTGDTESSNFPTTAGAFDTTYGGGGQFGDAFIAKLNPSAVGAAQLVYGTFIGGSGQENGSGILGGPIITVQGHTTSANFPVTANAFDATANGGWDLFLVRVDPSLPAGQQLIYGTYVGGSGDDGTSCRTSPYVDATGVITACGESTSTNFPTTIGAYDETPNGDYDVFLLRLDPSIPPAQQLVYSTVIGSTARESSSGCVVDADGVATITGQARSAGFPVTPGAFQTTYGGAYDGFIARVNPFAAAADQLVYSSFLGGSGTDEPMDIVFDPIGRAVVVGRTSSSNFPTTPTGTAGSGGFLAIVDIPSPGPIVRFFNTLGSAAELAQSVVGPPLLSPVASGIVLGTPSFGPGLDGHAVSLGAAATGSAYGPTTRNEMLAFSNVPAVVGIEQGTIEAVFRMIELPEPSTYGRLVLFASDDAGSAVVELYLATDSLGAPPRLHFALKGTGGGPAVEAVAAADLTNGVKMAGETDAWMHVAAVWDRQGILGSADRVRLYVNNRIAAASTSSLWTNAGGTANRIGGCVGLGEGLYAIDELKIWSMAKTDFPRSPHMMILPTLDPTVISITNGMAPPDHYLLNVFTFDPANAGAGLGTGWFAGLHITYFELLWQLNAMTPPYLNYSSDCGTDRFRIPGIVGLTGGTVYSVTLVVDPAGGIIEATTAPMRYVFP